MRFRANRRVQRMDYIARGLYRELLDEQWSEGTLPADLAQLADICGCPVEVMREKWPQIEGCFLDAGDERIFNQTLEDQRTDLDSARVKMARGGRNGGLKSNSLTRSQGEGTQANPKPTLEPGLGQGKGTQANPDIEEKSKKRREELEEKSKEKHLLIGKDADERSRVFESKAQRVKNLTAWAEKCHLAYPRKVAKQDSLRAFIKHISKLSEAHKGDDAAGEWMLARVEAFGRSSLVASTPLDKLPYPATWANDGRYDDPAAEWSIAVITKTLNGENPNGNNGKTNGAVARIERNRDAIRQTADKYRAGSGGNADGSDAGQLPEPGVIAGDSGDVVPAMA